MLDLPGKILIGPVYNYPPTLGKWLGHPDLKLFVTEPAKAVSGYDLIYTPGQDSLADLLGRLPTGWEPDWILWWDLVFQPLPLGIEKSPYPLVAMVGDWNLGFQTLLNYADVFDFLIGDQPLIRLLQARGIEHCAALRAYSFLPELHQPQPGLEKCWDLSFIGNLNYHIHRSRSGYLQRLADLSEIYQVRLANGIFGRAYAQLLAQSRIVFNHSVRGEMNMRAYEAPACGALLMMEAENAEIRDVLQDGISCVLYSESDFEDKIHHYLLHEAERARIAEAGRQAIQSQTYTAHFEKIFACLPQIRRRPRAFLTRSAPEQTLARWKQILTAQTQPGWAALLAELELAEAGQLITLHAQTALWLDAALKFQRGAQDKVSQTCLFKARALWLGLETLAPHHWHCFYLAAWLACLGDEPDQALRAFEQALSHLDALNAEELRAWGDFVLPLGFFQPFEVAWQGLFALAQTPLELTVGARTLLAWQIHFQRGMLFEALRQEPDAIAAYRAAILARPDLGLSYLHLGRLLRETEPAAALAAFRQAAERGVLEPELWQAHAELALQAGWFAEARQVALRGSVLLQTHPQHAAKQAVFGAIVQVADFCRELAQQEPLKALSAFSGCFAPLFLDYLSQLKPWLPEPLEQAHALLKSECALVWHSSLGEPPPQLPTEAGFIWAGQGLPVGRSGEALLEPALHSQVLSRSELPFAFLPLASLAPVSLEELGQANLLVMARDPRQKALAERLFALEKLTQNSSELQLFLWFPQPELFSLAELEAAAEVDGWGEIANLTILLAPMNLAEIGGLFLQMQALISGDDSGDHTGNWAYYWDWAQSLGLPVGIWQSTGKDAASLERVLDWGSEWEPEQEHRPLLDWWQAALKQGQPAAQSLKKQNDTDCLNGLWQFRLRCLRAALTPV